MTDTTTIDWSAAPPTKLTVRGVALEYACYGPAPAEAPTLVLLHEGLGSVGLWRDFPEQLAQATNMGVFVYSRQGYGRSDPVLLPRPLDYMTREGEDVLGPLLDLTGIQSGILLGHSDGATIAAVYAGSISDLRIRGLILMAPHFFIEDMGLSAIRAAGTAFANGDLRARLAKHHDDVEGAFYGWHDVWTDPGFKDWDVGDAIDHLRIPVLAVQGREDTYGTLAQIDEIDSRIYAPFETAILDDCGHAPHLDQPVATLAAIGTFCARLLRLEREKVAFG